ncbi:MAG: gliding motility-associated C-terminal domain-containing protein [Bacteroidia bacterium]|nr:gliding motility-associated C-terminal domain-containing protein [Bacteroidia bacterium]
MKKLSQLILLLFTSGNLLLAQGSDCSTADPFCTGTTYTFPNTTGVPNAGTFGCLTTTPNPAWYYLQIATSGNIDIHIEQTNTGGQGIDVDFIMWGPFTSVSNACATNLQSASAVDCSYSTAAQEDANIPNAVAGEFYMLLLTNFSNQAGTISFSQTGGNGATDCSIVCGPPDVSVGPTQTIPCGSTTATLSGTSTTAGVTYSWTGPGGFTSTSQNPTVSSPGTYTLTVTDPANPTCPATAQQTVNLAPGGPVVTTGATQLLTCGVTTVGLSGNSTNTDIVYSWSGPGGFTSTSQNPNVSEPGVYTLVVTDTTNACSSTATQLVNIDTLAPTVSAGFDATFPCNVSSLNLNGNGSTAPNFSYVWTTSNGAIVSGSTTFTPLISSTGTYTITATNSTNGCTASDVVVVSPDVLSNASFTATPSTGQAPLVVDFINNSTNAVSYNWYFGNNDSSIVSNPTTTYTTDGAYTVVLITTNANGCADTVSMTIIVNGLSNLLIPNVFTPNGDGNNDNFMPIVSEKIASFKATVYDRWGLKMYEWTNSQSQGWNGNAKNGSPAPDGAYYYIIEAKGSDSKEYNFKGYIQLIRK